MERERERCGCYHQLGSSWRMVAAIVRQHLAIFFHSPLPSSSSSSHHPSLFLARVSHSRFTTMEKSYTGGDKNKNKAMVELLKRYGVIHSERVTEVMETIDRGLFVPKDTAPYVDSPMTIGFNATISAPHMHAMCLELLKDKLQPGMHALDVGSGTGYLTACFAKMVGSGGRVVGIEHIPELASWSVEKYRKKRSRSIAERGFTVYPSRWSGWAEAAPYDAIHVGAAAPEIPKALIEQLKPGGRLVIPVGTLFKDLQVMDKGEDGTVSVRTETSVRYVPLTSRENQLCG